MSQLANPPKKKLTTSAMIASIAAEGQPTKPAPFGHALNALAKERDDIVGLSADLSKYRPTYFCQRKPRQVFPNGHGRTTFDERSSRTCS